MKDIYDSRILFIFWKTSLPAFVVPNPATGSTTRIPAKQKKARTFREPPNFFSASLNKASVTSLANGINWRSSFLSLWTTLKKASEEEAKKDVGLNQRVQKTHTSRTMRIPGKNATFRVDVFSGVCFFVLQLVVATSEHYTCSLTTWATRCSKGRPICAIQTWTTPFFSSSLKKGISDVCGERSSSPSPWTTLKASEEEAKKEKNMSGLTSVSKKTTYFQYYEDTWKTQNKGKNIFVRTFFSGVCFLFYNLL